MNNHKNKHIRAAVDYALERGWRLVPVGAHAHVWGRLLCCHASRDGCQFSVFCTPKNPQGHARWIRQQVDGCPHSKREGD